MRLPISTIHGPDHYVIKVLVPGREADDLPEILISRTPPNPCAGLQRHRGSWRALDQRLAAELGVCWSQLDTRTNLTFLREAIYDRDRTAPIICARCQPSPRMFIAR